MLLQSLVDTIAILKARLDAHGEHFRANEIRTRMALVDPMLAVLGWDPADPSLVVPEYTPQGGRDRADYALMHPDGYPIVILEAKKLGESFEMHLRQMTNYANMAGISYAGLTDGNVWELYSVFEQRPISDRRILKISMSNDSIHEISIRMLVLWQLNLKSMNPEQVKIPMIPMQQRISETFDPEKEQTLSQVHTERTSFESGWESLKNIGSVKGTKPSRIKMKGDIEYSMTAWSKLPILVTEWLYKRGIISERNCQVMSKGRHVINNIPVHSKTGTKFLSYFQIPESSIYVFTHGSADNVVEHTRRILEHFNQDSRDVYVKYN